MRLLWYYLDDDFILDVAQTSNALLDWKYLPKTKSAVWTHKPESDLPKFIRQMNNYYYCLKKTNKLDSGCSEFGISMNIDSIVCDLWFMIMNFFNNIHNSQQQQQQLIFIHLTGLHTTEFWISKLIWFWFDFNFIKKNLLIQNTYDNLLIGGGLSRPKRFCKISFECCLFEGGGRKS